MYSVKSGYSEHKGLGNRINGSKDCYCKWGWNTETEGPVVTVPDVKYVPIQEECLLWWSLNPARKTEFNYKLKYEYRNMRHSFWKQKPDGYLRVWDEMASIKKR